MSRYFFHVFHHSHEPDLEGSEFPDIHAAEVAAVRLCGEMIRDIDEIFWAAPLWQLQVTDQEKLLLFTLTFSGKKHHTPI